MLKWKEYLVGREVQLCVTTLLLAAFMDWPYGYYQFLRLAVCAASAFCAWRAWPQRPLWAIGMIGLILLFNPIFTINFRRSEWVWIDIMAALAFLAFPPTKKKWQS